MEVDEEDFLLLSDIVDVVGVQVLEITTVRKKGATRASQAGVKVRRASTKRTWR